MFSENINMHNTKQLKFLKRCGVWNLDGLLCFLFRVFVALRFLVISKIMRNSITHN